MKNSARHIFIIVAAVLLIVVGIIGLVLPFLPGLLLILVGLLMLSAYNPRFEFWIHSITKKYPPLHRAALALQAFIERILGKK